jgi:hypothetical protein
MKTIPLTQGKFALVDDADFEWLNQWKWRAQKSNRTYYAVREVCLGNKKRCSRFMHRLILDTPSEKEVDHRNNNGLDNQRHNLRLCTHQQNGMNQIKSNNRSSKYKGVSFYKANGRWTAQIQINNRKKHLGYFVSQVAAANAYLEAAKQCYGEFANTNFETETLYETDSIARRELQGTSVV